MPGKKRLPKGLRTKGKILRMMMDGDELDMTDIQICAECGGFGTGLGIDHDDTCLVPLAQACKKADADEPGP